MRRPIPYGLDVVFLAVDAKNAVYIRKPSLIISKTSPDIPYNTTQTMTQPPYPQHLNPKLTPEIAEDVAFFRKWGYLVVEDAITEVQVETLRTALDAAPARAGTAGSLSISS